MWPFSSLAFLQPTTVDNDPKKLGDFAPSLCLYISIILTHHFRLQCNRQE